MRIASVFMIALLSCALNADGQDRRAEPRRLWSLQNDDQVYDVSPDGRLAGYIDWSTGELWVRDLETGKSRNLTNKGSYQQSGDEAGSALFSPDGGQIAYEYWDDKTRQEEVRVISVDGTGVRTLFRFPDGSVTPAQWTPDGKHILTLAVTGRSGRREMMLVSTTGGPHRTVQSNLNRTAGDHRIAPDGRFVAYAAAQDSDAVRSIHIVNLQNRHASVLLRNQSSNTPIGWTRDGRLVFLSERGATRSVWAIRVVDGRAQGEPQLIRDRLGNITGTRIGSDGRLFYVVPSGDLDLFTDAFDAATGRLQSQPVSVTRHPGAEYRFPVWSPDGRYVAYLEHDPKVRFRTITVRSIEGDEIRELQPRVHFGYFMWLPNGQSMMLYGADDTGRRMIHWFDLETGITKSEVVTEPIFPAFSRDSRFMFYARPASSADRTMPARLVERDLGNGREREVYVATRGDRIDHVFALVDGGRALVTAAPASHPQLARLWLISIETGASRMIGAGLPADSLTGWRPIGLTPDRSGVLVAVHNSRTSVWGELWMVPLDDGPAQRLASLPGLITKGQQSLFSWLSPDGRRILYRAGRLSWDLWVLDDSRLR
jgi:Tol biopolymer transport system component